MIFDELKKYNHEIKEIIDEVISYKQFEDRIRKDLKKLQIDYQQGKFEYEEYQKIKKEILLKEDTSSLKEYSEYIINLLDRIEYLNTQCFLIIYDDNSAKQIELHKNPLSLLKKFEDTKERHDIEKISTRIEKLDNEELGKPLKVMSEIRKGQPLELKSETIGKKTLELKPERPKEKAEPAKEKTALDKLKEEKELEKNPFYKFKKQGMKKKKFSFFQKKEKSILEKLKEAEKGKDIPKTGKNVQLGSILNMRLIKSLFSKIKKEDEFITKKTKKTHSLLELKDLISEDNSDFQPTKGNFFATETSHIKKLLDQKKVNIYNPSSVGYLANFFVRKLTLYFIESYPNFFKDFYLTLRKANIKILSNTYVNIMAFSSLIILFIAMGIVLLVSLIQQNPFLIILAKTLIISLSIFIMSLGLFYYYPFMKVSERTKSINTNLPFSIDQMASVVSSGVPPSTMFKLIAKTKDYGEVSTEVEKISNLIEVFGYDLVSAVRSVTITTPSKSLKEFFEGFISTVETGGSLKKYFSQKSKEAMLSYQLERQKYLESISTYSDIYTGLLIAAPLFFVSTLSLVSLLGGKVGSMNVSTIMVLGTYLVIPLLNVLFIVFLEFNQPEV